MAPATRTITAAAAVAAVATALTAVSTPAIGDDKKVFNRTATFPVYENLGAGEDRLQETVAEISDVTDDGNVLVYTDAPGKRIGFLSIKRPSAPRGLGTVPVSQDGDAEAEPTSLVIAGKYILVAVNTSESYKNPSGRLDVIETKSRKRVRSIDLGGQPDSIALSADGKRGIVAIENERDEEVPADDDPKSDTGDLPQQPAGFVSVLDLKGKPGRWKAAAVRLPADAKIDAPSDPEPEYVSVNRRGKAAVTLQENNGIAIVDLAKKRVEKVFSAGEASVSGIDAKSDGRIDQTGSIKDVPREPDSIAWVGDRHVATANEGDWKGGTRGWTIFNVRSGKAVFDSKNSLDRRANRKGLHNDTRASKKGPEPEGLAVATMNGRRYGFVGSERSNFVAVYDFTRPTQPTFLQMLPTTNGPEGIKPIPERGMLAVSSEVDDAETGIRSTVALYRLGASKPGQFPDIVSANDDQGNPIGWNALGALSAKPGDPQTLYTATDNAVAPSRILTVDVKRAPASITRELPITQDGQEVAWDVEAISARRGGGFWVAVEGATGPENALYRVDDAGKVQEQVKLPAEVAGGLDQWGLEGVSSYTGRRSELVYVALQRPLAGEQNPRIGRYDVRTKKWSWFAYPLEKTNTAGDWLGLSELTVIRRDKVAVIERDKQSGPTAKVKRIYAVRLPKPTDSVQVVRKKLAIDLLPFLRSANGWTQEKTEGMAITGDGDVYVVTDNDGLKDATGETVFGKVGRIKR